MENKEVNENCVMPDYKDMFEEAQMRAEYWEEHCKRLIEEAAYLRGIKEAIEAVLGRKIGSNNGN